MLMRPDFVGLLQLFHLYVFFYAPLEFENQDLNLEPRCFFRLYSRIRLKNSGSIEIEIESELKEIFVDEDSVGPTGSSSTTATSSGARPVKATHNPWVLKCHRDHLSKLQKRSSSHTPKEKETHTQSKLTDALYVFGCQRSRNICLGYANAQFL